MSEANSKTRGSGGRRPWLLALVAVAAVALLVFAGRSLAGAIPALAERIEEMGVWGPVVFVCAYAAATVAFAPGSILTLAGGAIFGIARGTAIVFVGATTGAALAFLVARYLARSAIESKVADYPRFAAIDSAIGEQGRKIVFLLRLSPVFPFNLLNYALGLTRVRFADYLVASLGMIPRDAAVRLLRPGNRRRGGAGERSGGCAGRGLLHCARGRAGSHHRGHYPGHAHRPAGAEGDHGGLRVVCGGQVCGGRRG